MKTITPTATGTYGYGAGLYYEPGYAEAGYVVDLDIIRVRFRYQDDLVEFARGPQYPAFSYQFIQPEEESSGGWPLPFPPVVIQAPFNFTFPWVSDAELEKLRSFMFSVLPVGSPFTFENVGNGSSITVRFASLKIRAKHQLRGYNEVTLSMVRA